MKKVGKWLRRDVHTLAVHYKLCLSEKEFHRDLKKLGMLPTSFLRNAHSSATAHFFWSSPGGKRCCIVCLAPTHAKHTIAEVHGLLVHEAMHIWRDHLDQIGEREPSEEMACYGLQIIAQELMHSYHLQTGRGSK